MEETTPLLRNPSIQSDEKKTTLHSQTHLTAAYKNFTGRITKMYLKCKDPNLPFTEISKQLQMRSSTITKEAMNIRWIAATIGGAFIIGPIIYKLLWERLTVQQNEFALVKVTSGNHPHTEIYGPGYYVLPSLYYQILGKYNFNTLHSNGLIESSVKDLTIAIVDQGTIKHFTCMGQNVILGPGVHLIREPAAFVKTVDLNSFYIEIGPEKWVTIPDTYEGIANDNGKNMILTGGQQHHLSHANYTFLKLVPKVLQTDRIVEDIPGYVKKLSNQQNANNVRAQHNSENYDATEFLKATTAEGQQVTIDAAMMWRIEYTQKAINAMELLRESNQNAQQHNQADHIQLASRNIDKLRENVLRIVKGHLTALIGKSTLAGGESFSANLKTQSSTKSSKMEVDSCTLSHKNQEINYTILSFLQEERDNLLNKVNEALEDYGIKVTAIDIYDAKPSDQVQEELDTQIKARVQQNTAEIHVQTKKYEAQQIVIQAEEESKACVIRAKSEAEAIRTLAQANQEKATLLSTTLLGQQLATLNAQEKVLEALTQNATVFIGSATIADLVSQTFMGKNHPPQNQAISTNLNEINLNNN